MALCLAESLVACQGFDPVDQLRRHVRWWREGHLSCTGAIAGNPKTELLAPPVGLSLDAEVAAVAAGSFARNGPPTIRGTGYAVDCLACDWVP